MKVFQIMGKNKKRLAGFLGLLLLIIALLIAVFVVKHQQDIRQHAAGGGNITIDYTSLLQTLNPLAMSMAETGYQTPNVLANDTLEQQRVRDLKLGSIRMHLIYSVSGDPTSKIVCGGGGCDTGKTGDQWINAIKGAGAEPIVIVDTKSSSDAANLVTHFNKDTNNPIKYWIIGNEPNINGYSVQSYSSYFNQDYDAMKTVDPSILVGGGTTAWYDQTWLTTFLQLTSSRVDFVDFHGYPQQGTTAGDIPTLFNWAAGTGNDVTKLRSVIQSVIPNRANQIFIEVGEWSLNWGGNAQGDSNFNTVWTADVLGNILKNGGISIYYGTKGNAIKWANGTNTDWYTGITYNMVLDDPKAPYHGYGMFTGEGLFQHFGNTMVNATTTLSNIDVFASDNPKNIVVINKDPSVTQTGVFSLNGILSATVDVWRKDNSVVFKDPPVKIDAISVSDGSFTYALPPFSVTTFVLNSSTAISSTPTVTFTPTNTPTAVPSPTLTPSSQSVTSFTLWNAQTNSAVQTIANGTTINISSLPATCLNIRATTSPSTVGSVVFGYDGNVSYHTENSAPYDVGGDASDNITPNCWTLAIGTHTITATPFTGMSGTGTAGTSLTVTFTVVNTTPTPTATYLSGDINHSGCINILDFNLWLQAYQGHPVTGTFPDVNNDGTIDILDFNAWLTTLQSLYNNNPNDPKLCTN